MKRAHPQQQALEKSSVSSGSMASPPKGQGNNKDAAAGKGDPLEDKLKQLPSSEAEILRSQIATNSSKANFFSLFRFATPRDIIFEILGIFFAAVHGVSLPMFTLVVGGLVSNFDGLFGSQSLESDAFMHKADHLSLYFVYIGVVMLVSSSLESILLTSTGEILAGRFRKNYLNAVIRQNIAYSDNKGSGEVATRITNDTIAIQEAISEKLGNVVMGISSFITAVVIGLARQWKVSLVLLSAVFYNLLVMTTGAKMLVKFNIKANMIYSGGSTIAEESLSSIRSTIAFGMQGRLAKKFDNILRKSSTESRKAGAAFALMLSFIWAGLFWIFGLGYWEGSRVVYWGEADIGKVFSAVMAMMIGSFRLGNMSPNIRFIANGIVACKNINDTLDRMPIIDSESDQGLVPDKCEGHIKLSDVRFRYPSRPDVLVLPDFSLEIFPGQTIALVGMSGSGKSTIVGILERFYLPVDGTITLDGNNISELNISWLRRQIGYVQQEPTLFNDSIYTNVAYGLIGTEYEAASEEIKKEKVIYACKEANAHDFITTLNEGYDTNVGDRGFLLSGGQKQRIAIARAIVSDPKILLLDEATSALDTKSEGIVQEALDRASQGRTTIVIAHRLSTIKNAHSIVVMSEGEIIEQGSHTELLSLDGYYASLVAAQEVSGSADKESHTDSDTQISQVDEKKLTIMEDGALDRQDDPKELEKIQQESENIPGIREPKNSSILNYSRMLWRMSANEHSFLIIGVISAILLGYCYPSMGIASARMISDIIVPKDQYPEMRHNINVMGWWMFFLGCASFIFSFVAIFLMSYVSAGLVRTVRLRLFSQFLRMDIAFFDHKDNSPGALTAILAKEAKAIEGLGGATAGQILQSLTTLIGGIATGIPFNWRIGLVALAVVPVLLACGFFRVYVLNSVNDHNRKIYEASGALASQYATAVRTVQSLTSECVVVEKYGNTINRQVAQSRLYIVKSAVLYALSEGLVPWIIALIYWWGSKVMSRGEAAVFGYFVVFMAIVLGTQSAGQIFSHASSISKARTAARNVYRIDSAIPTIDTCSQDGIVLDPKDVHGNLEFRDVYFHYPLRPQVPVLRGLSLSATEGQYIALVGPSGCGKSTVIGLAEHFYNVERGQVLFDGVDIADYNIQSLRSHIALVSQEPTLYSGTLRDNILLGWPGDESEVTDDMIHDVAKKANIHDFIMSLPDGYNTISGSRGTLLSGGQKQRIAIARALIRNPKVLLLDEATSALDSESERVVQAALDEAAKGRTTIAVAHRLSTIQKADVIYVFEDGRIVEKGNHAMLLAKKGRYSELVGLQTLSS